MNFIYIIETYDPSWEGVECSGWVEEYRTTNRDEAIKLYLRAKKEAGEYAVENGDIRLLACLNVPHSRYVHDIPGLVIEPDDPDDLPF